MTIAWFCALWIVTALAGATLMLYIVNRISGDTIVVGDILLWLFLAAVLPPVVLIHACVMQAWIVAGPALTRVLKYELISRKETIR